MTCSIFRYAALNKLSEYSSDSEDDVKIDIDSESHEDAAKIEPELDTKIKGGDQMITYDVSFISAFPFIVAKAV